jgi:hypothetical protein
MAGFGYRSATSAEVSRAREHFSRPARAFFFSVVVFLLGIMLFGPKDKTPDPLP